MKIHYLFLLALSFGILSCSSTNDEPEVFKNNTEINQLWIGEQSVKYVGGLAHSGERASVVDSVFTYGLGIERKMTDILKHAEVKKVIFKAWIYSYEANPKACVVFCTGEKDKPAIFWGADNIDKLITTAKQWQQITMEHTFNAAELENPEGKTFAAYFWNSGNKGVILIDDVEVEYSAEEE
jgi:hypothetical protein